MNMKHLKRMAVKQTIKQAKKEILNLKKAGKKIDHKEFERYVKDLYSKNLKEAMENSC